MYKIGVLSVVTLQNTFFLRCDTIIWCKFSSISEASVRVYQNQKVTIFFFLSDGMRGEKGFTSVP